jgi:hypothetical protein
MEFELNGRLLRLEENNDIWIWGEYKKHNKWTKISVCSCVKGYKHINIGCKRYSLHRIIGYLFLGLDIDNPEEEIDHIDNNPQNNNLENLRVVTHKQNQWNKNPKGYCWDKNRNKFRAKINYDGKCIYLGRFDIEDEAKQAYLNAKKIYHIIS